MSKTAKRGLYATIAGLSVAGLVAGLIIQARGNTPTAIVPVGGQAGAVDGAATSGYSYGVNFKVKESGYVSSIVFQDPTPGSDSFATIWTSNGKQLARATGSTALSKGWRRADFGKAVKVTSSTYYSASFWSPDDQPAKAVSSTARRASSRLAPATQVVLGRALLGPGQGFPRRAGRKITYPLFPTFSTTAPVVSNPTAPATPAATPGSPAGSAGGGTSSGRSDFPNASNTGVPAGTALSNYGGNCTITKAGTVIEGKVFNCDVLIKAPGVVIRKSKVNGVLDSDSNTENASVTVEDSEIDGLQAARAAVSSHHITILRANIHGGKDSVQCNDTCTIKDSWLHGQYIAPGSAAHLNGFISNGGKDMTLIHNTIACDAGMTENDGGCTADVSIFGDFEPTIRFTMESNYFVASTKLSYCVYGGYDPSKPYASKAAYIVYRNNTFQRGSNGKCGLYGAVTSFNESQPGNVWSGNVWEDGKTVTP